MSPSGTELDFFEVIADLMSGVVMDAFQLAGPAAHRPRITEMLPDLNQLWLTDRDGQRYSAELRFVAYDGMTED